MSNFTFLTREQSSGKNKLNVLKKVGTQAIITDYAILLGGHVKEDKALKKKIGCYWTKSEAFDERDNVIDGISYSTNRCSEVYFIDNFGFKSISDIKCCNIGARLVLPLISIGSIPEPQKKEGKIKFGYCPQKAASRDLQEKMERVYKIGASIKKGDNYQYDGKLYRRVEANPYDGKICILSNGEQYKKGDNVWVEYLPVNWLIDEESGIVLSENILFAGVPFDKMEYYEISDFDKTFIKSFMDEEWSKKIFQYETNRKNLYGFDFFETSEVDIIENAVKSNVSIFLHGKTGCGKSERVHQLDPDFTELNLGHLDPELLDGLAGEKDGKGVHIKPPWLEELEIKCQEEPDKIHILFLEELTNASKVMQSKAYGIALDKKVAGKWKLPENTRVVAAGNELEDSIGANEMPEPLFDRFAHLYIETTTEKWLKWAVTPEQFYKKLDYKKDNKPKQKIHPAIYAFISLKGDEVLRTPYNKENPKPHADPRRWKMASDMLYESNNPAMLKAIVGEEVTREFIEFCQIPRITIEDVLSGNYTEKEIESMDLGAKLATVSGLIAVDSDNMPKIREFTKKLGEEMCKKFEVQWTHGDEERLELLQEILLEEKENEQKGEK